MVVGCSWWGSLQPHAQTPVPCSLLGLGCSAARLQDTDTASCASCISPWEILDMQPLKAAGNGPPGGKGWQRRAAVAAAVIHSMLLQTQGTSCSPALPWHHPVAEHPCVSQQCFGDGRQTGSRRSTEVHLRRNSSNAKYSLNAINAGEGKGYECINSLNISIFGPATAPRMLAGRRAARAQGHCATSTRCQAVRACSEMKSPEQVQGQDPFRKTNKSIIEVASAPCVPCP